jgi:hypothetical protein
MLSRWGYSIYYILGIMKPIYTILLLLLVTFVAYDVFRVAILWDDFRTTDVVIHSIFAVGAFVIIGFNTCFMLFGAPTNFSAHFKLLSSFFGQVIVIGLFSTFTVAAWIGKTPWSCTTCTICFLLFLFLLFVRLILWSKKQSMPNSSFK